jgi:hypothetical protein
MKYIRIGCIFIGLSGNILSVDQLGDTVSEIKILDKRTNEYLIAFQVTGNKNDICDDIADFLDGNKKLLEFSSP